MDYKITGYEPAKLFHYFEEISAIPRESGNEKQISDYLVAFAKDQGLWVYHDAVHNVIIKKAASAGAEDKPAVMLQGHIDMVCDKLGSVEHDLDEGWGRLQPDRGWLRSPQRWLGPISPVGRERGASRRVRTGFLG